LLAFLQQRYEPSEAIRQFVQVLNLNREYAAEQVEQAIRQALKLGFAHRGGIQWCLSQMLSPQPATPTLDLSAHPHLVDIGHQPLELSGYDRLLDETSFRTGGYHGD
jgi:hypothetical protein